MTSIETSEHDRRPAEVEAQLTDDERFSLLVSLLGAVPKGAWGYRGYVMSDWGAVESWDYALKGDVQLTERAFGA